MSNTPIIGAPELAQGQAVPETTVNEAVRYLEQGAGWFRFIDRDLATPPGSPADGDCYLVAASATGAWATHDGEIAFYQSTAWTFIAPAEGFGAWVADEDVAIVYDGSAWSELGGGGGGSSAVEQWAPNFTANGSVYIPADDAMTIAQGNAKIGTGTIAFEKSTAASPGVFASTTLPATLEAGAWLKVAATGVTGFVATHLVRTA